MNHVIFPLNGTGKKETSSTFFSLGKERKKHVIFPFPSWKKLGGKKHDSRFLPEGRKKHPLKGMVSVSLAPLVSGRGLSRPPTRAGGGFPLPTRD